MQGKLQENSENFRLSRKQEQAILELVLPDRGTLADVAKKLGVSERTVYNWLSQTEFQKRLQQGRNKIRAEALEGLKTILSKAVKQLESLLGAESDAVKLRASQAILEFNLRLKEAQEIEERLEKLEQLLGEKGHGKP